VPTSARTYVKASVIYLCLGAGIGAVLLVNRWVSLGQGISALRSSHIVFLIAGWLTQFILGVAWWLFPPRQIGLGRDAASGDRHGQTQRGSQPLFWATFGLLNAGVLLQSVCSPFYAWTRLAFLDILARLSAFLLLAAAITFVANMWGRVRELGRR
jgi:hypothetical protein